MSRLFTFGCSFTNYNWPTWANLLGYSFMLHQNWGFAGLGNRAIAERVAEAHVINNFNKDDVVIIQWSDYRRNDYAKFDRINDHGSMWCTLGSPAAEPNKKIYDINWFKNFWDEKAYYIHTLHNIILVQQLLKSIDCKWYMTSMTDLILLPAEAENLTVEVERYNIFESNPDLLKYKKYIWEDHADRWLPPIIEEKWISPNLNWKFDMLESEKKLVPYFQTKGRQFIEPHLTTLQYSNYLERIEIDIPLMHNMIKETADEFESIYIDSDHDWEKFAKLLLSNKFNTTKSTFGK